MTRRPIVAAALIAAAAAARAIHKAEQSRRSLQFAGALASLEIGTHVDAYSFVWGQLTEEQFEQRAEARRQRLRESFGR